MKSLHLPVADDGVLYQLLIAIDTQLTNLERTMEILKSSSVISSTISSDLDSLAKTINCLRQSNETDRDFSLRLSTYVANYEVQTINSIQDVIEDITGWRPDIEEYPAVDFVTDYGLKRNGGAFRIRIPYNKHQQYVKDVKVQTNYLKAAGIAIVIDMFDFWFEDFSDDIITNYEFDIFGDLLLEESTAAYFPIYGLPATAWDDAKWDMSTWDEFNYPSDMLTIILPYTEFLSGLVEVISGIINYLTLIDNIDSFNDSFTVMNIVIDTLTDILNDITIVFNRGNIIGYFEGSINSLIMELSGFIVAVGINEIISSLTDVQNMQDLLLLFTDLIINLESLLTIGDISLNPFYEYLLNRTRFTIGVSKIGSEDIIDSESSTDDFIDIISNWDEGIWDRNDWDANAQLQKLYEVF